ncbi:hypothetical protein GCM10029978_110420 [Actinoallomurus acanthiterrae]
MVIREFIVPTDEEVLYALGVEPEPAEPDTATRVVRIPCDDGQVITLSYDSPGGSVRLQLHHNQRLLLDIFREGAELLRIDSGSGSTSVTVDFRTESTVGQLEVQVQPEVVVRENSLLA